MTDHIFQTLRLKEIMIQEHKEDMIRSQITANEAVNYEDADFAKEQMEL